MTAATAAACTAYARQSTSVRPCQARDKKVIIVAQESWHDPTTILSENRSSDFHYSSLLNSLGNSGSPCEALPDPPPADTAFVNFQLDWWALIRPC